MSCKIKPIYQLFGISFVCLFTLFSQANAATYEEIEWTALMPNDDLAALLDPPEFINQVVDGSNQDSVAAFTDQAFDDKKTERYQSALVSTRVIDEFDGKAVRIPGYVVPLAQNNDKLVTEFFIVPYFGACLHMPPPPPNQIIYVDSSEGIEVPSLEQPFWFEGKIDIETSERSLGTSAYTLELANHGFYE